jgi:polysaccharide export outer membrane protein
MTKAVQLLLWGVISIGLAVPAPAQTKPAAAKAPEPESLPDYYLAPGDILQISVWKEPELRENVFVRLDGKITVPLIGDVVAAGRTIEQLTSEVTTRLKGFLETPQVTITLAQAVSARFFVIGEVGHSGSYPLTGRTTVLQALALAGGFREFAKREKIMVIREKRGERNALAFNFRDVGDGTKLEQNIVLESGDTVIVP